MAFVPITPVVTPENASLEARELARDIEDAIVAYQEEHPRATQADIQQALKLAQMRAGEGMLPQRTATIIAVLVGVFVALAMAFFLVSS